jgi:hypothetical protein
MLQTGFSGGNGVPIPVEHHEAAVPAIVELAREQCERQDSWSHFAARLRTAGRLATIHTTFSLHVSTRPASACPSPYERPAEFAAQNCLNGLGGRRHLLHLHTGELLAALGLRMLEERFQVLTGLVRVVAL